ncbi:MAG: hypothetical protein J1F35_05660 [Erysipelotrichales bacterium]|nr:hypothetical protein [Erysipelotrichales bacterium]
MKTSSNLLYYVLLNNRTIRIFDDLMSAMSYYEDAKDLLYGMSEFRELSLVDNSGNNLASHNF